MFIHLAVHHHPRPDKTELLIQSMHRFGPAMKGQSGLQQVFTLRDEKSGALVGLALWDSKEQWLAARTAMTEAVKDDPSDEWEEDPPEVFQLEVV